MPDQSQKPLSQPAQTPKTDSDRKPSIRTMKSDVEQFFKTTKPSLIQIIGLEATTDTSTKSAPGAKKQTGTRTLVFFLGAIAIAGTIGFLLFRFISPQNGGTKPKLVPPLPFFATETSRTISAHENDRTLFLRLMADSMREQERQGTIKRIVIKLQDTGGGERFATVDDFLNFYRIEPPGFSNYSDSVLMPFISYSRDGPRFGIAFRTRDPNRALRDLLSWEPSLLHDWQPLFFNEKPDVVIAPFEDRIYRNIDWRFLKLSQEKDLGIAYTVFPAGNVVILTTSKEAFETTVNRLFDAR